MIASANLTKIRWTVSTRSANQFGEKIDPTKGAPTNLWVVSKYQLFGGSELVWRLPKKWRFPGILQCRCPKLKTPIWTNVCMNVATQTYDQGTYKLFPPLIFKYVQQKLTKRWFIESAKFQKQGPEQTIIPSHIPIHLFTKATLGSIQQQCSWRSLPTPSCNKSKVKKTLPESDLVPAEKFLNPKADLPVANYSSNSAKTGNYKNANCCDAWMAKPIHWWTVRWLELYSYSHSLFMQLTHASFDQMGFAAQPFWLWVMAQKDRSRTSQGSEQVQSE